MGLSLLGGYLADQVFEEEVGHKPTEEDQADYFQYCQEVEKYKRLKEDSPLYDPRHNMGAIGVTIWGFIDWYKKKQSNQPMWYHQKTGVAA